MYAHSKTVFMHMASINIVTATSVLFTALIALFQNFLTKSDEAYKHFLLDK